jgi:putative ABC transport system permease protein
MDELFGVPTHSLAVVTVSALGAVLFMLALMAWRRPLLVRLGLRAVPRRRLRTALIVLGLTTSTAVIATAIGTGETMASTVRALVAGGIGPVDIVISASSRGLQTPSINNPQSVLAGGDLAAGEYFTMSRFEALAASAGLEGVAAFEPAIQSQATAVSPASGRARTGVNVIALRPGAAVFDGFTDRTGKAIRLSDLQAGEVLVNAAGGLMLGLAADQEVVLRLVGEQDVTRRVRAVVRDGGLAGVQPAVILPLADMQEILSRPGQINQMLVAQQPGGDAERRSREITGRLRLALADRDVLTRAARGLASESGQGQLRALEDRVRRPEARDAIEHLREISRRGEPSAELAYYLADPLLTTDYRWVASAVAGDPSLRWRDVLESLAPLQVLEVKQRAIAAANEYGSAVTTVFLILGLFSIAASLLLVFLIFVMLAAERRVEMGLTRAVGAQRHHLVAAFAVEGLVYDLAASLLGLALGVGVGAAIIRLLQRVFDRYDVTLRGEMSGGSMLLSFSIGALVTFATVLLAAWRVSRVNIIAAIHGLPEPDTKRRRSWVGTRAALRGVTVAMVRTLVLRGPLLAIAGVALVATADGTGPQLATGGALLVLAVGLLAAAALTTIGAPRPLVNRVLATVVGPVIALLFAVLPSRPFTVHSDEVVRSGTAGFVLAGVAMAMALVWAAGANLDVLLAPVRWLARPFGSLAPATRLAVAYPLTHPFRTGLTAAMFALVFLTMVAATTLLRSTEVAYVKRDGAAGFDIRAQFSRPPADFSGALAASPAVRPEDFTTIGAQSISSAEALWPDDRAAVWRPIELRAADEGLLGGSSGELLARARGYESDEAVWRAVGDGGGGAIVSRRDVDGLPGIRTALGEDGTGSARFEPATVWVRDPRGGTARKLSIIGVATDNSILPRGLLTSQQTLRGTPAGQQPPAEYFLRTRANISLPTAATGLTLTFPDNGVRTRVLGDEARTGHAVRSLLDTLIRGFLGMGLASGIAALGVVGMRSVAERRQQIGMLRALGLSRRAVQATFLIEGSVVAVLGITMGGIVGLVLARNVVAFMARDFTELRLIIPWWQVFAIAGAAYAAALISALAVAWQAGRVSPAEALRYE